MEDTPDTFTLAFTQGEGVPIAQTRVISARESFMHRLSDDDAKRYGELDSSMDEYMPYICGGIICLIVTLIFGIAAILGSNIDLNAVTIGGWGIVVVTLLVWPPLGMRHVNKQLHAIATRAKECSYEVAATQSEGNLHLSLVCYGYIDGKHRRVVLKNETFSIDQQDPAHERYSEWTTEARQLTQAQEPPPAALVQPWKDIPISNASEHGSNVIVYR